MNVESIIYKMNQFDELIIDSGFQRDLNDFIQSIQQPQNKNLIFLKDIAGRIKVFFDGFYRYGLDKELNHILRDTDSFFELNTIEKIKEIDFDSSLTAEEFFQNLNGLLAPLNKKITVNKNEIDKARLILSKYVTHDRHQTEQTEQALMSIVFKDLQSTRSIKQFSRVLQRWDRTLLMYHTLLTSKSPKEIALEEIQNGSIDVVFNIDIEVALDLADLISVGLKAYGAYLLYKAKLTKDFVSTYLGNKKLMELEEQRDALMLENIKDEMNRKVLEQHENRSKEDKKIDKSSTQVKINEVTTVFADHIIRGNEVKLLSEIVPEVGDDNDEDRIELVEDLKKGTAHVKGLYDKLEEKDKQLLIDKYTIKEDDKK